MTAETTCHCQHQSASLPTPLVSVEWLAAHLDDPDLVVLCASMGDPARSLEAGIPGALLADIEAEFSDPAANLPHTVPARPAAPFEQLGISADTKLVIYDRHGAVVSPRVWWLARVAGLDQVAVLDGGLKAWQTAGHPVAPLTPSQRQPTELTVTPRELFVSAREVEQAVARSGHAVIDARSGGRFAGVEPEPRGGVHGGHIPGSVNLPFPELFDATGCFHAPAHLRAQLQTVAGEASTLLTTCGSGVTACIIALAARLAGYEDIRVYDGSWAEWGSKENSFPIAR